VSKARSELAAFLRRRREQLSPTAAGLTSQGPRRTPGLRREEVAMLAGVGLTWYTWLEQARDINVSRQVINSLARTLRLTASEHEYVLRLAGYEGPRRDGASWPVHGQRVLDAFGSSPAYAVAWDWTILAWNDAYAALYPTISQAPPSERNLLWLVWTDPGVRDLLPDWETDSRRFVAMYRADIGPRLGSPKLPLWSRACDSEAPPSPPPGTVTTSTASPVASEPSSTRQKAFSNWNSTNSSSPISRDCRSSSTPARPAKATNRRASLQETQGARPGSRIGIRN
jgi:transcriptional regulator with XRE-family HTH domain